MPPLPTSTLSIEPKRPAGTGRGPAPPYLFVALECDRPLAGPLRTCLADVDAVELGRSESRQVELITEAGIRRLKIGIPDARMSSRHAQLIRALGKWVLEDLSSKNGTFISGVRTEHAVLGDSAQLELGHTVLLFRASLPAVPEDPRSIQPALDSDQLSPPASGMSSMLPALERELLTLAQVAPSPVSILLYGATGTGKEVLARAIHSLSRPSGPIVAVNCGALPDQLVESELFGHKKGAFSGANEDRPGLIRSADGGTLFLDEIGDLPLESQAALLRVLEDREVHPVGAARSVKVDFRVVAATHRDLDQMAAEGRFRSDLLARLSGFTLQLPRLVERREDLGLLIRELLVRHGRSAPDAAGFSTEAARAIFSYAWPLNVRELDKAIEAALVLAGSGPIDLDHLPESIQSGEAAEGEEDRNSRPFDEEDLRRRDRLIELLREHGGNVSAVARVMGKARMQVQRWIKRYGIEPRTLKK